MAEENIYINKLRTINKIQIEENTIQNSQSLDFLNSVGALGIWDWHLALSKITVNRRFITMLGYTPDEFNAIPDKWDNIIHFDDKGHIIQKLHKLAVGIYSSIEDEFRIRTKSGQWIWVLSHGYVTTRDDTGRPVEIAGFHIDITRLKTFEYALKESEKLYRGLFEQSLDAVAIVEVIVDVRVVAANESASRLTNLPSEQSLGRTFTELLPKMRGSVILEKMIETGLTGKAQRIEYVSPSTGADIEAMLFALGQGQCAVLFKDISERKRVEDAIHESEARYSELFNSIMEGVGIVDENEIVRLCNPAFSQIYDAEGPDGMIGKNVMDFTAEEHKQTILAQTELRKNNLATKYELRIITMKGREKTIMVSSSPRFDNSGKFIGSLGAVIDISRQKQDADALREDEQRLRQLVAELESKNIALREVLSIVEQEKTSITKQIASAIETEILPVVEKMVSKDGSVRGNYYRILRAKLRALSGEALGVMHGFSRLTPREIEICMLIREGASSREVAKELDIALVTVTKHRENIRKKLGVVNDNVNLVSFLKNIEMPFDDRL